MKLLVAALVVFSLGVLVSWLAPWTNLELVEAGILEPRPKPGPEAPPPPDDVLAALRTIARVEEKYSRGRASFGTLADLASTGLVTSELGSGMLAGRKVEVRAKPGIPGPIWIARIGKWVANEQGLLFEIPCDPEGPWW